MTVVALVACSAAGADSAGSMSRGSAEPAGPARRASLALPEGWKPLLPVAAAVAAAAKADGVIVDGADAWGEPAMGCYAAALDLHSAHADDAHKDAAALTEQVLAGLAAAGAPRAGGPHSPGPVADPGTWSTSDVVKPTGTSGVLALSFERAPYRGRVRARLGEGRIAMFACFHNQREPAACEAACTRLLEAAP
jgi:hypothetical protein